MPDIHGIHHITAITNDAQKNLDFYAGFLGLRLVKRTVNFDDPFTYHLYYGDAQGNPGSILTFFAWPGTPRGRQGTGQAIVAAFSIAQNSLGYWIERCLQKGIKHVGPIQRFDESVLIIHDPDGMTVELVAHPQAAKRSVWEGSPVPPEHVIRGLHGTILLEEGYETTADMLMELGFRATRQEQEVFRFETGDGGPGTYIDVKCAPDFWRGQVAAGTIHHVAFRTADNVSQEEWRKKLSDQKLNVSPIMDRSYFRSIYFREPGGILFEIATDPPGFTADEPQESLGSALKLPPWYEIQRKEIESALPKVRFPMFPALRS